MASKESIITIAMLVLVTYTMSLSLVSQAFPAGQASAKLSSAGSIQIQTSSGIGIYSNAQCTNPLTSVAWGTLEPGGSQTITCYIKNEGSTSTILSLQTTNWSSTAAQSYLSLNWNYDDNPIPANTSIEVILTLSVASNIEGVNTFSFDIDIIGTT